METRARKAAESSAEKLAYHRWHWTLDQSNPDRMSYAQYARHHDRTEQVIRRSAKGYALYLDRGGTIGITEAKKRADMSPDTEAATEAVAAARGVTFVSATNSYGTYIRRVREIAAAAALRRGTSVAAEARRVARTLAPGDLVRLRVPAVGLSRNMVARLKAVLSNHPGSSPVYLHMLSERGEKVIISLGDDHRVEPRPALYAELRDLLGPSGVRLPLPPLLGRGEAAAGRCPVAARDDDERRGGVDVPTSGTRRVGG